MPLILSGSAPETHRFCQKMGLWTRHFRHVATPYQLAATPSDEILVLPSFYERRDRHAYLAALRNLQRRRPSKRRPVVIDIEWDPAQETVQARLDFQRQRIAGAREPDSSKLESSLSSDGEELSSNDDKHQAELDELFGAK